jgi:hypothetical protein
MKVENQIARAMVVVDRSLRAMFPEDYDQRCMYAAFGIQTLLRRAEMQANIVGGDFMTFVVAQDGRKAAMQGFGSSDTGTSHFWVETPDFLIDLGPHYLSRRSSFPAARLPFVRWRKADPLPAYLHYNAKIRYAPDAALVSDEVISARMEEFVGRCLLRAKAILGQPTLPIWLLTGAASLDLFAQAGDSWAIAAKRYVKEFPAATFVDGEASTK